MPEETPKYTIAKDLGPNGEMRDPLYEHAMNTVRVKDGVHADMGFTHNDFAQHIAGLPKDRRSKSQIAPFVNAVYDALEQKNWYAALALALTLPDICADLEKPKRGVGERYVQ